MTDGSERYGLLARFDTPEALVAAVRALRDEGFEQLEAFAPYPVEGLAEALGFRSRKVFIAAFVTAAVGGILTYFMQWYAAVISYPYISGGKPLHSWPAFIPATFAVLVLLTVWGAVFAMLAGNRLPKPYHPAFNIPEFARASEDGFFLVIAASDSSYDQSYLSQRLPALDAAAFEEVPV
ncbi:MAG TPA: DUF3341 domain-containing protein [Wenzhouxiangella sp.]|nr:DUF3341 domain-containing protein [Wenzhouxiangella sp.]